jgi:hypothetical protein
MGLRDTIDCTYGCADSVQVLRTALIDQLINQTTKFQRKKVLQRCRKCSTESGATNM